ncbi:hypothetical protein AAC387_Pa07g2810 [Persea americana]
MTAMLALMTGGICSSGLFREIDDADSSRSMDVWVPHFQPIWNEMRKKGSETETKMEGRADGAGGKSQG